MDLETYEKATEYLNKYRCCERLLAVLSDSDSNMESQKSKRALADFATLCRDELLGFVHGIYTQAGMDFEDLHCECRPPEEGGEGEPEPEEPVALQPKEFWTQKLKTTN